MVSNFSCSSLIFSLSLKFSNNHFNSSGIIPSIFFIHSLKVILPFISSKNSFTHSLTEFQNSLLFVNFSALNQSCLIDSFHSST